MLALAALLGAWSPARSQAPHPKPVIRPPAVTTPGPVTPALYRVPLSPGRLVRPATPAEEDSGFVMPARYQPANAGASLSRTAEYQIQLQVPGPERVFRVESEAALRERIRQEFRQRDERAEFPPDVRLEETAPLARSFPPHVAGLVPSLACYQPLYFEDLNSERYGWDAVVYQPFLSTALFYADLAILPYKMTVHHPLACEFNTGYYRPGDAAPYYLYLPPLSGRALIVEAATVTAAVAIFP